MGNVKLVRIDNRYVHGQVAARLVREYSISKILLINDAYAKDLFMTQLFKTVALSGASVEVLTICDAVAQWQSGAFEGENVMLLWGTVQYAYDTYHAGLTFDELNIGNLPGGPGRERVDKSCYIDALDAAQLRELESKGVNVYFQGMPDLPKTSLSAALKITKL